MSADNYIFIDRKKKPIEVWACTASETVGTYAKDDLNEQKDYMIGKATTLSKAIKMAEKAEEKMIEHGYSNEYGICFKLWCK